jgi:hypothetical protein
MMRTPLQALDGTFWPHVLRRLWCQDVCVVQAVPAETCMLPPLLLLALLLFCCADLRPRDALPGGMQPQCKRTDR